MAKTLVEDSISHPDEMRAFQQERMILEATEAICTLMGDQGVARVDLARRLGKTKGYITQLLDGRANMTLRTLSDVFFALDASAHINASELSIRSGPTWINLDAQRSFGDVNVPGLSVASVRGHQITCGPIAGFSGFTVTEAGAIFTADVMAIPDRSPTKNLAA